MSASVTTGRAEAFPDEEGGAGGDEADDKRRAMGDDWQMRLAGKLNAVRTNEARDNEKLGMMKTKCKRNGFGKVFREMG